ncbi:MAG: carbamoyl-phosphate synthase large subunit [Defluviitaleaceae bacterium]|nr:carbamoyl-phosphate synthase large subunit [Defluviitaleaceae bacterium]
MPLNKNLKKVMLIGSGPIVIGQAAEFDYAGTQACRVLREEGIEIVLVNSNPATIMTDGNMAEKIYIEPLTIETLERIIEIEKPDGILSGLGGQTGLTLCMKLAKSGFLDKMGVKLLGSSPETIDKAEDRQIFKDTMEAIGQPCIPSRIAHTLEEALAAAKEIGYPAVVRPAFTLGGTGGGIVDNEEQMIETATNGLMLSPISQILVEKSIKGWKEIEFEVMRDGAGNVLALCPLENFDPVGVHTGDSIVVAPTITLAEPEFQMLRNASLEIVESLGVEGGCNVQLALNPDSFEYAVIEVNPRVSRSSALASKATGYPIAKVSTKIAIGYTLDEIKNAVTGTTYAAFEPSIDYVVIKLPKWPFDKFVYAQKELGTQMKAAGEVMAIGSTFEEALLKAVRGAELGMKDLNLPRLKSKTDERIKEMLETVTDQRLFVVYEAIKRGMTIDQIHDITKIDRWFLNCLLNISKNEDKDMTKDLVYKTVDTCAGEFEAATPYFYSTQDGVENEALSFVENSKKERIIVLGSGPIRIGQGIEFDYASVHCVWELRNMGYEVIVINNNPSTLSTDFDTADRLYFEPLYIDDVMNVINLEKPIGVMVAFGGGTAIKLTRQLHDRGVRILGTSADSIDICEDRDRFDAMLEKLEIKRPKGAGVFTKEEALKAAQSLGYPVVIRPSYVLGGQNMIIAHEDCDVEEYMDIILQNKQDNPILVDKYLKGIEIEVDAICDGTDVLLPGIMEHIESAGVHSGDSIAVYPAINLTDEINTKLYEITRKICKELNVKGLVNIQYVLHGGEVYVIEVNPRVSRTVPYLSKVTGIPMCSLATKTAMGVSLQSLGYTSGIAPLQKHITVKVPVFSFQKLTDLDTHLGPEMKSTGEVLGIGRDLQEALFKGLSAAYYSMKKDGGVIITVTEDDREAILPVAKKFADMGFKLYATDGCSGFFRQHGLDSIVVDKIHENPNNNISTKLESGEISYLISTSTAGRNPAMDATKMRRKANMLGITCLTSVDTANALVDSLQSGYTQANTQIIDVNTLEIVK